MRLPFKAAASVVSPVAMQSTRGFRRTFCPLILRFVLRTLTKYCGRLHGTADRPSGPQIYRRRMLRLQIIGKLAGQHTVITIIHES